MNKPKNAPTTRFSREEIKQALLKAYVQPEWAAISDVPTATGSGDRRICDVLAMQCYPSRGLHLTGFEVVASKSEWKAELATPDKAEAMGRYCTYWYVVANVGDVPVADLPHGWGLFEVAPLPSKLDEAGQVNFLPSFLKLKEAEQHNTPKEVGYPLLAAVMRRATKVLADPGLLDVEIKRTNAEAFQRGYENAQSAKESAVLGLERELKNERTLRQEIETALGFPLRDIAYRHNAKEIGAAIKFVLKGDLKKWTDQMDMLRRNAKAMLDVTEEFRQVRDLETILDNANR